MNTKDFIRLGIPLGEATRRATDFVSQFILSGGDKTRLEEELKAILPNPALFAEDPLRKELAKAIVNAPVVSNLSCGSPVVEFEQASQPLSGLDFAS